MTLDRIVSALNPVSDTCEVGLSNVPDPVSVLGHVVRWQAYLSATAVVDITTRLVQGTVEIASVTYQHTTTATATRTLTLTATQADAITDYPALRLRFVANKVSGADVRAVVTWAEFEVPDYVPTLPPLQGRWDKSAGIYRRTRM